MWRLPLPARFAVVELVLRAFTHFCLETKEAYHYINIDGYRKHKMRKIVNESICDIKLVENAT